MGAPDGQRWAGLERFVRDWYMDPLRTDPSPTTLERLSAAEGTLGFPLPKALAEWFHRVDERLLSYQDDFADLSELRLQSERLHVLTECHGDWYFGIDPRSPEEDPPVFLDGVQVAPTLSGFLALALLWQTTSYAAIELLEADDEHLPEVDGPLGPPASGVRGRELSPEYADFPLDGLEELATLPLGEGAVHLYADADRETLVVNHLDDSTPPQLLATMVATRTPAAEERAEALVRQRREEIEDRRAEAAARRMAEEAELLAGLPETDEELVALLDRLDGKLKRFEAILLDDFRRCLRLGTVSDGQRQRIAALLKKPR